MLSREIRPGDILEAPSLDEPLRVQRVHMLDGHIVRLEGVGQRTKQAHDLILTPEDLAQARLMDAGAPRFTGDAEAFFLALEAHRIRLAHQFDPLFAVNVSQVDPLPHQIEAVYHYMLRSPRLRFLLADDPGAGKTIMAGLLLKELKYRGLVQRTLIVVPGHLKDQWRREMKERFGEVFMLVDRSTTEANWGRNVWQEQPQVITSMDFAKRGEVRAALAETRWDLVIVDEAHKMSAYRYGEKTEKTERYRLGELLSRISHFLLFLTATPHRGDPENFRLLLDLLEPDLFANEDLLKEAVQKRENPIFLRRLKEDLRDFEGKPLFPPRRVFTRTYRLSEREKTLYNAVTEYVARTYNKALAKDKRNVAFAMLILQRRLASSVRAVRSSLERRRQRLQELLQLGKWIAEGKPLDNEDVLDDLPEEERLKLEDELLEKLTAAETREELDAEIQHLDQLIRLAREAERDGVETKLNELRQVMALEQIKEGGEKLLVFTESRDTLEYLAEKLRDWGYRVTTLHGGMNLDQRIQAEHAFRESAQVMISTEAGGEGINLQFCALMVNYDIPWTPNRLEQRMGRVHRYGQRKEVHIYNLVANDTREGKVLRALFDKLDRIRAAMGNDRVFDVIGDVLPNRTLKDLIVDAIANRRTLDDLVAEIEAVSDADLVRRAQEATLEALATRHIDLSRILGEDRRAREQRLVPEYIERFFTRACRYLNIKLERRQDGLWRLPSVPLELRDVSPQFKNAFGEVFREYNKIAFSKEQARRHTAVFVAPGHPLLESVIERITARCQEALAQGAVFADPDGQLDGWLWFVEGEVRDGSNQPAGKRLFVVLQPADGGPLRLVNTSILWDLKPAAPEDQNALAAPNPDAVMAFVTSQVLIPFREELRGAREREAQIKQKYGVRSLELMILESDARLTEYETRRAQDEPLPEAEIVNERRRKEDLIARKQALETRIRQQTQLNIRTPEILAVARVIPAPSAIAGVALHADAAIEAIGMQVAMDYERQHAREPEDVSAQNLGYDIRSRAGDGALRYIEVKARARSGPIVLTPNEWLMAHRLGDEYWLYVVENAADNPTLHCIQNPAAKLKPEEIVVRYIVNDWKAALEG